MLGNIFYKLSSSKGLEGKESTMWQTRFESPGQEDPLEKGMATHSSILAWRIPWTEEPGRLQSMEFSRPEYRSGLAILVSRGSSQPRDRTQVSQIAGDSIPAEPQRKPANTGVGSLSLRQQIFPTQELNPGI